MVDNEDKKEVTEEGIKIIDTKEPAEVNLDDENNETEEVVNTKDDKFLKEILNYLILIAAAFILAQVIHRYVFTPVSVDGVSMLETLHDKDYVFLWRLGKLDRFDIVVFKVPKQNDYYIKRLIGLPVAFPNSCMTTRQGEGNRTGGLVRISQI